MISLKNACKSAKKNVRMFINMEILANRNINIIKNSIWSGPGGKKAFDPKKIVSKFTWKILEFVLFSVNFQSINYFFLI